MRLGGRRPSPASADEPASRWAVAAFRAYAAYTRTADFRAALDAVLADAAAPTSTVVCKESVRWHCHRRDAPRT
ncbi:DUF488 family protein [Micromonospora peucetia]|uniref:DUF488 family protein n=1 Tax=Micromonospora peucetia TaxID=47871 RepID=UPI0022561160|nr:DUF488 family protein [Micromonospora peucetia]MCX4390285.1 DUF488 family protein [Micromonospora peucetia]